jgi:dihydrofolate reductase
MVSVDGLVMARSNYETILSFEIRPHEKPVVVQTRTMGDADVPNQLKGHGHITNAMPLCLMDDFATDGWAHAYVDGGLVVQSFLRDRLMSGTTLSHVPILLGSGRPLFGALENDIDWKNLGTTAYALGMLHSK